MWETQAFWQQQRQTIMKQSIKSFWTKQLLTKTIESESSQKHDNVVHLHNNVGLYLVWTKALVMSCMQLEPHDSSAVYLENPSLV